MDKLNPKISVIFFAIFAIIMTRILPHPPNFTAVGAAAIFGGAVFSKSWKAILVPLLALFISNVIINNTIYSAYYETFSVLSLGSLWVYAAIIFMSVLANVFIKSFKVTSIAGVTVGGTILFFAVTNFGAWFGNPMYPQTLDGLISAYIAGLPFVLNSLLGNIVFVSILFGSYFWATNKELSWLMLKK